MQLTRRQFIIGTGLTLSLPMLTRHVAFAQSSIRWPWAIILCQFNDTPIVPQPAQYYVDLFTRNGLGGVCDYWRVVSCNALDVSGSQVFGWFTMNHTAAESDMLTQQLGSNARPTLIHWSIEAAQANGVDLSIFRNILVVQNHGNDHGMSPSGNGVLIVHQSATLCEFGFICHEMGHGFGLPHSWAANPDTEYGDGWDVMSWQTTTYNFPIRFKGTEGLATVGLNTRNLEILNAVPAGRLWSPPRADFSEQITLDPLNQLPIGNHGFLIAKLSPNSTRPTRADNSSFTVEFRRKAGWDQAIPQDAILIHEVRTNGISYLQPRVKGQFTAGQQFVTPDPKIFVRVVSIDSSVGNATLRLWDIPEGSLRKEDSDPKVYLIENGMKRWVTSPQALQAIGKSWADVRSVPDGGLTGLPLGEDIRVLVVSVTPYPVPVNRTITVTVYASDPTIGASVLGEIKVNGNVVANTNTPFTHNFRTRRRLVSTNPREWEVVYPTGTVIAPGYPATPIDFGFPDL